jgi:gamma-glutamyltranspeptidase/glutathione hydrolase
MNFRNSIVLFVILFFLFSNCNSQPNITIKNGVVSSAQELASQVGIEILKNGGNAIDAAVGVGFTLAVVYPQAGNIGGGGFMVIHFSDGRNTSIDYRERAPLVSTKDMFLDDSGNVVEDLSTFGYLASGIPGSVAGMLYALEKYGTMSREDVMKYAIEYAEKGFKINKRFAGLLNMYQEEFAEFDGTSKIFSKEFNEGDLLIQTDLAKTLKEIVVKGKDGFYGGWVADFIVQEMMRKGGIICYNDLHDYEPFERDVITGTYRGYDIISMGPPSSGGICLVYLLNILENYDLKSKGYGSVENIQLMTEAMRRVYADRSQYMGDMDFVDVPVDVLLSKQYAKERMNNYNENSATMSIEIKPGNINESDQTTHYSITDKFGNVVSVTTTLNSSFGSKVIIDGTGFFLNNEMDDFVSKPGVPNIYGLLGSEANSIEPKKRMLSSMTPTIVLKKNKPFLVVGSPGGGRIITTVFQTIVNIIDFDMDLKTAIDMPRFHHQWYPDEIQVENTLLDNISEERLMNMGYNIRYINDFGRVDAIMFMKDVNVIGYSDGRGYGKALSF